MEADDAQAALGARLAELPRLPSFPSSRLGTRLSAKLLLRLDAAGQEDLPEQVRSQAGAGEREVNENMNAIALTSRADTLRL